MIEFTKLKLYFVFILALLSHYSTGIYAEESKSDVSRNNYPASFFDQYRPQNALEMVQLIPGFNFDQGSNERGFGGNAGNVLIDGARPTSKSGGIRSSLVRISASQVDRIELIRGGAGSGEASGQSLVANVIRKNEGTTGSWAFKERWTPHIRVQPNVEAALATKIGNWNTAFDLDIGAAEGFRTADLFFTDASEELLSSADEVLSDRAEFAFFNGEGSIDALGGKVTLNGRYGGNRFSQDIHRSIFIERFVDETPNDQFWDLAIHSKFRTGEFGFDWIADRGDWKWHGLALSLFESENFSNHFDFTNRLDSSTFDSEFFQDAKKTERIARLTYGLAKGSNFKPEYGFELAKNKLESDSRSFQNGDAQTLNGGDVTVEEIRYEAFATFVFAHSENLILEGGLTTEQSEIKVSGETNQTQDFTFIKPRLSLTYKIDKQKQLVFQLQRNVGQLNFRDFAASSQVSDDRTTSGNPDLAPDTTDEFKATYDWGFSEKGNLKIDAFYQEKSDILEQILLPSGGQGIGNAGDASFWGIETNLNLPLDGFLENGLLELYHVYRQSSFDDPVTNQNRTINRYTPIWFRANLRQDLVAEKIAWGLEYFGSFTDTNFFVDERQTFSGNKRLRVFIETTKYLDSKIQLEINNINTGHFDRTRYIFDGDRSQAFLQREVSNRIRRPDLKLTISRNF